MFVISGLPFGVVVMTDVVVLYNRLVCFVNVLKMDLTLTDIFEPVQLNSKISGITEN